MTKEQDELSLAVRNYEHVLVAISNPENAKQMLKLAQLITTNQAVFHIIHVTEKGSFPERERSWREGSELVLEATHYARELGRVAKPLTVTANSIPEAIVNSAKSIRADLVLLGWFGPISPVVISENKVVKEVLHKAPCDVGVFKSRKPLEELKDVMVPVGPNPPKRKRIAIIDRLLNKSQAKGNLVHVSTSDTGDEHANAKASDLLHESREILNTDIETKVIYANSVLEGLLTGSETADLIVLGPGREWVFNRFLFGRTADNLTNRSKSSVLMFKGREHKMVAWSKGLIKALVDLVKGPFS